MGFGFKSIGHFFATVAHDFVKGARVASSVADKAGILAPEIELLTGIAFPQAVSIERGAFAALGVISHAVSEAGDAVDQKGLNVSLDLQLVQDIKALIPFLEAYAKHQGVDKPVAHDVKDGLDHAL